MEKRIFVSVARGPEAEKSHTANSDALVNINGNYLHLDEEGLLTLTRLVTDSDIDEALIGSEASAGSLRFDDFHPYETMECSAGRL